MTNAITSTSPAGRRRRTGVSAERGQSSAGPCFWSLPTAMLSGTAAPGGIALINALGNLGGLSVVRDATGNFMLGLIALALGPVVSP